MTNARRAAYVHVLFIVLGVLWITSEFSWYIEVVQAIVHGDVSQSVTLDGRLAYPFTTAAIAAARSLFNVANTMLFPPFLRPMVRLLEQLVPMKEPREKTRLTDLDVHMLEIPVLAIQQSQSEILKLGRECEHMTKWLQTLREQDEPSRELIAQLHQSEETLDTMQDEVSHFITDLPANNVPHSVAEEARNQLRMADEYESVSDYVASLLKFDLKLRKEGLHFTEQQRKDLADLHYGVAD